MTKRPIEEEDGFRGHQSGGRLVPIPDPTTLTTKLVREAIDALKAELEVRFRAMDKAADLIRDDQVRVPTQLDRQIGHLRELFESRMERISAVSAESLEGIRDRFAERDRRMADANKAVEVALQTVKEGTADQNRSRDQAIAKSEASTKEALGQLRTFVDVSISGLNDKVADLKARIDRGEGKTSISDPAVADAVRKLGVAVEGLSSSRDRGVGRSEGGSSQWGYIFAAVGALGVVAAVVVDVLHR